MAYLLWDREPNPLPQRAPIAGIVGARNGARNSAILRAGTMPTDAAATVSQKTLSDDACRDSSSGRSAHLKGAAQLCSLTAPAMIWLSSIAISSRSKKRRQKLDRADADPTSLFRAGTEFSA